VTWRSGLPLERIGARLRWLAFLADWGIGVVDAPIAAFLTDPSLRDAVRWLPRPRSGEWYADPFGLVHQGRTWIFFESFDRDLGRAVLAASELLGSGALSEPVPILDPGVHTSYPFVFEHEGVVYCIPETGAANEIVLYRAESLPGPWRRVAALVEGFAGYDSTICQHDGRWWLWSSATPVGENMSEMFLWHAPRPEGPWTPHRGNPVKVDVGSVRCAGTPFVSEGRLFRPAQDCSVTYGGRVVVFEVTRMTVDAYEERLVTAIEPDPSGVYPDGLHTLSAVGDRTLIDGRRWRLVGPWDVRRRARRIAERMRSWRARSP
jgi:hypothetical protein